MNCVICEKPLTEEQMRHKGKERGKALYCSRECFGVSIRGKRKKLDTTPEERFMNKVQKVDSGCWEWTGAKIPSGYGRFGYTNENGTLINTYSHRISYMLFKGEIPKGKVIDHLCKNKSCVNPDHLEVVTQRVNVLRSDSPSSKASKQTHCVHGHPFDKENTYYWKNERRCRACGRNRKRKNFKKEGLA